MTWRWPWRRDERSPDTGDEIHIHNHVDVDLTRRLDRIERLLRAALIQGEHAMSDMTQVMADLQGEVARSTSVSASGAALIERLADAVEANQQDPAALQAIVDQLRSNTDGLAGAITANTPAEGTDAGDTGVGAVPPEASGEPASGLPGGGSEPGSGNTSTEGTEGTESSPFG